MKFSFLPLILMSTLAILNGCNRAGKNTGGFFANTKADVCGPVSVLSYTKNIGYWININPSDLPTDAKISTLDISTLGGLALLNISEDGIMVCARLPEPGNSNNVIISSFGIETKVTADANGLSVTANEGGFFLKTGTVSGQLNFNISNQTSPATGLIFTPSIKEALLPSSGEFSHILDSFKNTSIVYPVTKEWVEKFAEVSADGNTCNFPQSSETAL